MGFARERPARLAEKLLQIRLALGLSQDEMLRRLGQDENSYRFYISNYETGKREPSLLVLLEYARVANVLLEVLADDELDLPETIPSPIRSEGIRRTPARSTKR
ncbi:MAG TPA: helix-turn-helix transcriptional regulator [Pyrinomonadaceae bacterium]|nr:helix-turn-helix transcriptional regulator [Pyrinomonadaceae bacterium]